MSGYGTAHLGTLSGHTVYSACLLLRYYCKFWKWLWLVYYFQGRWSPCLDLGRNRSRRSSWKVVGAWCLLVDRVYHEVRRWASRMISWKIMNRAFRFWEKAISTWRYLSASNSLKTAPPWPKVLNLMSDTQVFSFHYCYLFHHS